MTRGGFLRLHCFFRPTIYTIPSEAHLKIELQEGDLIVFERTTCLSYFMRNADMLGKKTDNGSKTLADIQREADIHARKYELRAVLTNETPEFCIFTFMRVIEA